MSSPGCCKQVYLVPIRGLQVTGEVVGEWLSPLHCQGSENSEEMSLIYRPVPLPGGREGGWIDCQRG